MLIDVVPNPRSRIRRMFVVVRGIIIDDVRSVMGSMMIVAVVMEYVIISSGSVF